MHLRLAASAAFAIASCLPGTAWSLEAAPAPLTLDEAFARVARVHPELKLFGPQTEVLLAEREQAALKPPLRASLEVENVLGTGATRGFDAAEVTLSLAGVLERGGGIVHICAGPLAPVSANRFSPSACRPAGLTKSARVSAPICTGCA